MEETKGTVVATQEAPANNTETVIVPEVNESALAVAADKEVTALANTIKLDDPSLDVTYGTKTMQDISRFSDDLLSRVKSKDSGEIGETLTNLVVNVKDLDVSEMGKEPSFLEKLPVVGSLFSTVEKTVAKFQTLSEQVAAISEKLENSMVGLLHDIEVLEQLYKHNETFNKDLTLHINAGRVRLEEAKTVELPKLQAAAADSANTLEAQKVRDFSEQINRFERRLHDLEISRTITVQMAPQIRLIQSNNRALAQKIQTSVLTTIPIWKNQMVLGLSLHGQRNAAALQKQVADTTNDMLRKNAAMLEQTAITTAQEVERSIVDVETLREVHSKLISTIDETLNIAQEGRQKRAAVEKELAGMEVQLKESLMAMASKKQQQSIAGAAESQQGIAGAVSEQEK